MERIAISTAVLLFLSAPAFAQSATDGSCQTPADPGAAFVSSVLAVSHADGAESLARLRELVAGEHTDRHQEAQILDIFRNASPAELNAMIAGMSQAEFARVIRHVDDRLIGPDNRTAILNLLSLDRINDLSVASRSAVIGALQVGDTDIRDEKAIRNVFLATHGADLSALKKAIDHGEDHRDLQQLLFHDIDHSDVRGAILAHFAREGVARKGQVKVLSDIDDTFYENYKDDRYPRKTVYPGVTGFYAELDKGGAATPDAGGDLMFLSARPYDREGGSEHLSRQTIEAAGVKDPTILSGDFAHLIGNQAIADKKFQNWTQVRALYPEYGSVFVGDSGQGDAIFGAHAMATPGTSMQKVFIHNVTHLNADQRADFAAHGVTIFDTYVGAATAAYKSGLISRDGLLRVADGAQSDLAKVNFSDPAQKAAREADMARDLAAMRAALQ